MAGVEEDWYSQGCSPPTPYESFRKKYRTVRDVQVGSFGTVKIVRTNDPTADERAAKFVNLSRIQDTEVKQDHYMRTINEVKIYHVLQGSDLASDGHDNIMTFFGWYMDPGNIIIQVYELLQEDLFGRFHELGSVLTEKQAKPIIKEITSGLKFMHDKNIAHRDIKLENILCVDDVELSPVKICDLNLSKVKGSTTALSPLRSPVGTTITLDPQRAKWKGPGGPSLNYGRKCDMYGVGLIAHELLTLHMPFAGESGCGKDDCAAINKTTGCLVLYLLSECDCCLDNNIKLRATRDFEVNNSELKEHSMHCKDFIDSLLQRNEDDRMSSTEALLHPWLRSSR